jgi:peptidoglycan/LPS O-acetylase OafA/YrhL
VDRRNNFDILRLVAATSVIFSHAFLIGEGTQDPEPLYWVTGGQTVLGVVGVFVFFTISGFLVTQSFEATRSATRFVAKRALRIYPGLFVCLMVSAFALGPWASSLPAFDYFRQSEVYHYVVSNLVMIMPANTLPGVWFSKYSAGGVIDGPLWTLPCEVAMYLMVLALGLLRRLELPIMAVLIAAGMAGIWFDTASSDYFVGSALWLLPFFAAGMALYRLRERGIFRWPFAVAAAAILVISIPLKAFILLFPLTGSYLVIYLALEPRLPAIKAARFGDLSYGLYIYGWPVEQMLVQLNGGTMAWPMLFALALPITAALAFLSWHLIEERALRLKPGAAPAPRPDMPRRQVA